MQVFLELNGEVKSQKPFLENFHVQWFLNLMSVCVHYFLASSIVILSNSSVSRFEMISSALVVFNKAGSLMIFAVFSATL